jgi:hypothetical protein
MSATTKHYPSKERRSSNQNTRRVEIVAWFVAVVAMKIIWAALLNSIVSRVVSSRRVTVVSAIGFMVEMTLSFSLLASAYLFPKPPKKKRKPFFAFFKAVRDGLVVTLIRAVVVPQVVKKLTKRGKMLLLSGATVTGASLVFLVSLLYLLSTTWREEEEDY